MKHCLLILLILTCATACNHTKGLSSIKRLKKMELLELGQRSKGRPTNGRRVIEGYEVKRAYALDEAQSKRLVDELLNEANYIGETRRCQLVPQYAVQSDDKTVLLFELRYCPKLVYLGDDSPVSLDISTQNTVVELLQDIKAAQK